MTYDSELVSEVFGNLSVDKSRLPANISAIAPKFVTEWLVDKLVTGRGKLTLAEQEKVNEFVQKAFPRKDDANIINFHIHKGEVYKLIALMQVRVKVDNAGNKIHDPVARIPSLKMEKCQISNDLIESNTMLLRQGVWGKISLARGLEDAIEVIDFDPFQCSSINLTEYAKARSQFTSEQWRDLMLCSMGCNPEHPSYTPQAKTWMLARLLPLVEQNYHMMELAPKGTGKSYIYENINSKVSLISGGKVTPAQLFINGSTKEVGLLGRHDVVILDEAQSLVFTNPEEVIGSLKTYLASNKYNRSGFADISSDCSLVLLANIELDSNLRPRNEHNLLVDLPPFLSETAFLDRFAGISPGWEIPKFRGDMVASQVGLKMDFFGEVLLAMRQDNRYMSYVQQHIKFDEGITIRDQNAIYKSASGFLKILYPHLELTLSDFESDCLKPALQMRQAIRTIMYNLDDEFRQSGREIIAEVK
ncbi:MAG: BREX system Lon protease-like protein BrxL [Pseudanabaena sp.]